MNNWKNIHEDFGKIFYDNKTYQQVWEEHELTCQDAKEWTSVGFEPEDDWIVIEWRNKDFTPQETKSWREIGLTECKEDIEFASYLRWKNHQPNQTLNLEQLRKEFNAWIESPLAQEYLDWKCPIDQRNDVVKLDISFSSEKLTGNLDCSNFISLKWLNCRDNKLTSLNLSNCVKLVTINCSKNQLTDLDLSNYSDLVEFWGGKNKLTNLTLPKNCSNLRKLDLSNNSFHQDLSFLQRAVNLEELDLNNSKFYGSLEPLREMKKLNWLNISDTDINSGLEYLPKSIKVFYCLIRERKGAKCKSIYKLFANEQGVVETEWMNDGTGWYAIKKFPQKLQVWKANPELAKNFQKIVELEKTLDNFNLALVNGKIENENTSKVLDVFQFETEERIREMRKENQECYQAQIQQVNFSPNPGK